MSSITHCKQRATVVANNIISGGLVKASFCQLLLETDLTIQSQTYFLKDKPVSWTTNNVIYWLVNEGQGPETLL